MPATPEAAGSSPPQPAPAWLAAERAGFRWNRRLSHASAGLFALSLVGGVVLLATGSASVSLWAALLTVVVLAAVGIETTHRRWRWRAARLAEMAAGADAGAVGPLAEALNMDEFPQGAEWRRDVAHVLAQVLRRVGPGDAAVIAPAAWHRLGHFVDPRYSEELEVLQLAILGAAVRLGDTHMLAPLRTAAKAQADSPEQERVCAAAERALEALQARIAREREERALLRPAGSRNASEVLLRPVAGEDGPDAATLPRPADGPRDVGES